MSILATIVVPCYNEAKNIPLILQKFEAVIGESGLTVLLVNNGSTDNSAEVFDNLIPNYDFAKHLHVPVNKGYGHGIITGLKACETPLIGWTHADLQTDPADVVKALAYFKEASDVKTLYIKGRRRGRPFSDTFFTVGMSLFETVYLKTWLMDINAQPNIFSRAFFDTLTDLPSDFSLDLSMYYQAKQAGLKIKRFDVLFPERVHGESSWNTSFEAKWRFIKRTLQFSRLLKKRIKDASR
jgi:glycosyltransferase involved in cell wall biosynthesis